MPVHGTGCFLNLSGDKVKGGCYGGGVFFGQGLQLEQHGQGVRQVAAAMQGHHCVLDLAASGTSLVRANRWGGRWSSRWSGRWQSRWSGRWRSRWSGRWRSRWSGRWRSRWSGRSGRQCGPQAHRRFIMLVAQQHKSTLRRLQVPLNVRLVHSQQEGSRVLETLAWEIGFQSASPSATSRHQDSTDRVLVAGSPRPATTNQRVAMLLETLVFRSCISFSRSRALPLARCNPTFNELFVRPPRGRPGIGFASSGSGRRSRWMTFCSTVAISIELAKPGAPGKVAAAARKRRKDLINGIAR